VRRLIAQIEGILDNFSRPLVRLENEVVAALGELAVRVAGNLVGRAYEAEPELLAQLVNEAVDAVGGASRDVEVRLHPDDIAALAPVLNLAPNQRLTPDLSLSRGDLRVHAEAVRIDGTLDARLRGALDAVIRKAGTTPRPPRPCPRPPTGPPPATCGWPRGWTTSARIPRTAVA